MVIAVKRKEKRSEKTLRVLMVFLAVLFLLQGIIFSRAFMLPCMLMTGAYFWYSHASRREYEYTLDDGHLQIERVASSGRTVLHEINLADMDVLASPDDPCVARYKKGGEEKVRKFDYTSYEENRPYYTMIAREDGQKIKLLLDLTPEAISLIRQANPPAVKC